MGGLALFLSAVLAEAVFLKKFDRVAVVSLTVGFAYLLVGLLDDVLKKKHKENLGAQGLAKGALSDVCRRFAGLFCSPRGLTTLNLPFTHKSVDIGWGMVPLAVFVFLATVNSVNLTDGLDGLAAGTSLPFFLCLGLLIAVQGRFPSLALFTFCLCGALAAYPDFQRLARGGIYGGYRLAGFGRLRFLYRSFHGKHSLYRRRGNYVCPFEHNRYHSGNIL